MKSVISKNLQATFYGMQSSSASVVTISSTDVLNTAAVLISVPGTITQSTGTTTLVYPDLYLADPLDSRLS